MAVEEGQLMKIEEVLALVGFGKSTLYKMISAGLFPRPVRIGLRAVRWRRSEILAWLESLPRATEENWR